METRNNFLDLFLPAMAVLLEIYDECILENPLYKLELFG